MERKGEKGKKDKQGEAKRVTKREREREIEKEGKREREREREREIETYSFYSCGVRARLTQ